MALQLPSMLMFPLIIVLFFQLTSAAIDDRKPSPFRFIGGLQGCHRGDTVNGIQQLKKYLEKFGYLNYSENQTHANDDNFDGLLESAVKTYQTNHGIRPTGDMDSQTVSEMMSPRCGVPDIINGTNWMMRRHNHHSHASLLRTVSHYSFFPGSPRWPPSKTTLTYAFLPLTPNWATTPVASAFSQWDSATHFNFIWIQDYTVSDMTISFQRLDHGDGSPFDGPGGTIAHAFAPTNGRFHYDGDETWSVGATPNAFDLETVALHEIGHLLGLGHSSVQSAIMFPSISSGTTKGLHQDDIQGIRALYNR